MIQILNSKSQKRKKKREVWADPVRLLSSHVNVTGNFFDFEMLHKTVNFIRPESGCVITGGKETPSAAGFAMRAMWRIRIYTVFPVQ